MTAFGRKRVEISAGAILLWAVLFYLDEDGLVPLCLLSCALHELGHLLAIYALGGHAVCLRLSCVGAELRLSARDRLRPGAQILSALAGPLVNLAAGFAALRLAGERGWCFAGINFALAAFNLLPAGDLDGGRALSCLLAPLLGADRARQALALLSAALAAGLLAGGAVMLERGYLPLMPWCLGVWLLAAQKKRKKHLQSSRRYDKLPWTQ